MFVTKGVHELVGFKVKAQVGGATTQIVFCVVDVPHPF
jgi:hypothetical protein